MVNNPYRIPDDGRHRTLNISGGRSSGYMLRKILDAHGGELPPNVYPIFCNTGREMPETLNFVHAMQTRWKVPIAWLEYESRPGQRPKHHYRIVSHNSAARNGEPFADMLEQKQMLPNAVARICTGELKVKTADRYVRRSLKLKADHVLRVLGIRYDEPKRWEKALLGECNTEYPMVHAKVQKADVLNYWYRESPFNLEMDGMFGNCDLCFMKGKKKLLAILRKRPDLADWWVEQENKIARRRLSDDPAVDQLQKKHHQFRAEYTVEKLLESSKEPQFWDDSEDDAGIDCFCTD